MLSNKRLEELRAIDEENAKNIARKEFLDSKLKAAIISLRDILDEIYFEDAYHITPQNSPEYSAIVQARAMLMLYMVDYTQHNNSIETDTDTWLEKEHKAELRAALRAEGVDVHD